MHAWKNAEIYVLVFPEHGLGHCWHIYSTVGSQTETPSNWAANIPSKLSFGITHFSQGGHIIQPLSLWSLVIGIGYIIVSLQKLWVNLYFVRKFQNVFLQLNLSKWCACVSWAWIGPLLTYSTFVHISRVSNGWITNSIQLHPTKLQSSPTTFLRHYTL